MTAGRPRKWDPETLADSLDAWGCKESSLILGQWVQEIDAIPQYITEWAHESTKFDVTLKKVKNKIATRREHLVNIGKLNYGVYQRYQGMYDHLLHTYEREAKEHEASLRARVDQSTAKFSAQELVRALKQLDPPRDGEEPVKQGLTP